MIFNNKRDINLPNGLIDYAENKEFSGHSKEIDFLYDGNRVEKKKRLLLSGLSNIERG